jgi:biofilm PGA synthesis N-glycosyltransferase PgaC
MIAKVAIITPAYNEAKHIGRTIEAVARQTVRPSIWIIVNDGSNDETERIVDEWCERLPFIKCVPVSRTPGRHFGHKARAFNKGVSELDLHKFDFIGNLDADILLEPEYFENILRKFETSQSLGISGGIVYTQKGDQFVTFDKNPTSVGGAVQLFRLKCFLDIGSAYMPLQYGGIDAAAEFIAKMKGWKVQKSLKDRVYEQRPTGSAETSAFAASVRLGRRFHSLGYGWGYFAFRCLYRIRDHPFLFGSIITFAGYSEALLMHRPILLPSGVVSHLRARHRDKMLSLLFPWRK